MKRLILICFSAALLTTQIGKAQDTTATLLKLPKINYIGLYVAPEFQYGQLKNGFTGFGGNSFMLLINKKLGVGLSMSNSLSRNYSPSGVSPLYLHSNFRGLKLEYILNGNKSVHFSFPITIGMASANTDSANVRNGRMDHTVNDSLPHNRGGHFGNMQNNRSNYMVVQPGVQVEANIFKFMKVYAGATYRFAWKGTESNTLPVNTVQGLSANVGVKVGLFEIATHKKKK